MESRVYSVLIVDDDEDLIDLLQRSLTRIGHFTVHVATDGPSGLAQYYAHHPDCVIIDIRMPKLDGYQLVRALRGDPDSAGTPLILLTAMATDRDKFDGLASGADLYLIKPVTPQALAEAVRAVIARTDAEREADQEALLEGDPPEEGADE
jgi:DNA-binding response OmpR family regulator